MTRKQLLSVLTLVFFTAVLGPVSQAQQWRSFRPQRQYRYQTFSPNGSQIIVEPGLGYYYGGGPYARRYYSPGYYSPPAYGYGYGGGPVFDARSFGYSTYGF